MADYTMYSLPELRKLSKANFPKIQELEKTNETIDVSLELSLAKEQDVAIRNALAIKQEEADKRKNNSSPSRKARSERSDRCKSDTQQWVALMGISKTPNVDYRGKPRKDFHHENHRKNR